MYVRWRSTAHRRAGTPAAAAPRELGGAPERRSGYRSSCVSNFLDAIYAGQPFRTTLRDLGLTPNQVSGLTKTDEGWSTALEAALTVSRRVDLQHGTNAGYVAGCVCKECRSHQRVRMAR